MTSELLADTSWSNQQVICKRSKVSWWEHHDLHAISQTWPSTCSTLKEARRDVNDRSPIIGGRESRKKGEKNLQCAQSQPHGRQCPGWLVTKALRTSSEPKNSTDWLGEILTMRYIYLTLCWSLKKPLFLSDKELINRWDISKVIPNTTKNLSPAYLNGYVT